MRNHFLLFIGVFALPFWPCAQVSKQQKLDSLRTKFQADSARMYRYKKWHMMAALDNRSSFVRTNQKLSVNVGGLQAGMVYKDKHTMGIGFYAITGTQSGEIVAEDQKQKINLKLDMSYGTAFYEYNFLNTKRWEISVPAEIGAGSYRQLATDSVGNKVAGFDTTAKAILLLGTGVKVSFRIFQWLGVGVMGGYRLVGGDEPKKINLNGFVYSYGIEIYFGRLYKMAKFGLKRRTYRINVEKINKLPD